MAELTNVNISPSTTLEKANAESAEIFLLGSGEGTCE